MTPSAAAPEEATAPLRPTSAPALFTPSLSRANVVRGGDALATVILTYALPLLVLTSTGSTMLTGQLSQRSKSGIAKGTKGWVRNDGLVNLAG